MWSLRSSRTSCSIFIKPSQTWSIRRFTSCRPTVCPARALSRRSTRSRMCMRTGAQPYGYRLFSDVWKHWFTFYLILAGTSWQIASLRLLHGRRQKPSLPWLVTVSDICSSEESEALNWIFLCWYGHVVLSVTDAVFLILYKELYYRHIYAKVSVSVCSSVSLNDKKSLCEYSFSPLGGVSALVWCEELSIMSLFFICREVQLLTRGLSPTTITATSSTTFSVSANSSFTCDGIQFG